MKELGIRREQTLAQPIAVVARFFSDPTSLGETTPPSLDFRIVGRSNPAILEGTRIDYELPCEIGGPSA